MCSICDREIDIEMFHDADGNYKGSWSGGHNAEPVTNGRCCSKCNDTIVIPMRLEAIGYIVPMEII